MLEDFGVVVGEAVGDVPGAGAAGLFRRPGLALLGPLLVGRVTFRVCRELKRGEIGREGRSPASVDP